MSPRVVHLALAAALALTVSIPGIGEAADAPFAWSLRFESELGNDPTGIALGDFNLDGHPDHAVSYDADSVALLFGDGRGGIGPRRTYAVQAEPFSITVADLDQDGRQDLVVPSSSHVTILYGRPLGEFGGRLDIATGGTGRTVAVADFDNDSKLDLAVSRKANPIAILRGTGTGGFHPATFVTVGAFVDGLAAGDVDHDGKTDVVAGSVGGDKLLFLRGRGDGTFEPKVETTVGVGPQTVALGDLDGDGDLDAVTANFDAGNVAVAYWTGTAFSAIADLLPMGALARSAVIGDVSGDGRPDIVATFQTSTQLRIFRRTDTGFAAPETISDPARPLVVAALGDVDHDGRLDIAVAARSPHALLLFRNVGGGPLSPKVDYATIAMPRGTTFVDATGDGRPDLLNVSYGTSVISLRPGDGEGGFGARVDTPSPLPQPTGLATADVNRDGIPDLALVSVSQDSLKVLLGTGAGTFVLKSTSYLGAKAVPWAVAFGYADADTFPDLAVTNTNIHTIRVFRNDGTGGYGAPHFTGFQAATQPRELLFADVDGDGDQDLVNVNFMSRTLAVRKNDGTGQFGSPTGGGTPSGVSALAAGDLDGDGRVDFVTGAANIVSTYLNPGTGLFPTRTDRSFSSNLTDVEVVDIDGDGRLDVLAANGEGRLEVLLGDGKGGLGPAQTLPALTDPYTMAVADVDADSRPDVALTSNEESAISVYLSKARTRTALSASPNPSPLGGMVSLTATVTVPDGTQPPAGTVRFHDGVGLIGEALVVGGVATLSFPANVPWFREYDAEFVGADRLRPSRSPFVPLTVYVASVDVSEPGAGGRGALALAAPSPNPLRGEGLVARFTLPAEGAGGARLGLHDVRGRRVEELDVSGLGAGTHAVSLRSAADLPAGLYFVRLDFAGATVTRRVVVLGR